MIMVPASAAAPPPRSIPPIVHQFSNYEDHYHHQPSRLWNHYTFTDSISPDMTQPESEQHKQQQAAAAAGRAYDCRLPSRQLWVPTAFFGSDPVFRISTLNIMDPHQQVQHHHQAEEPAAAAAAENQSTQLAAAPSSSGTWNRDDHQGHPQGWLRLGIGDQSSTFCSSSSHVPRQRAEQELRALDPTAVHERGASAASACGAGMLLGLNLSDPAGVGAGGGVGGVGGAASYSYSSSLQLTTTIPSPIFPAAAAAGGMTLAPPVLLTPYNYNASFAVPLIFHGQPESSLPRQGAQNWPFEPPPVNPHMLIRPPAMAATISSSMPPPERFFRGLLPPPAGQPGVVSSARSTSSPDVQFIDRPRRPHSGIWLRLLASQNQSKGPFLPQIAKSYLRIKDGRMPVGLLIKYLVNKLSLDNESQVEMTCRGHELAPSSTLQHVRDHIWRNINPLTTSLTSSDTQRQPEQLITLLPDSSTADHLMILHYARKPVTLLPADSSTSTDHLLILHCGRTSLSSSSSPPPPL
ncbi:hypothetical protein Dimus_015381 [Dionaea muscipula]